MTDENKITVIIDEDLADLIPMYLENKKKDIAVMQKSLNENDYENIRLVGHSMKGSGGGYGFDEISRIGKDIEEAAQNQERDTINVLALELEDYISRVDIVFE